MGRRLFESTWFWLALLPLPLVGLGLLVASIAGEAGSLASDYGVWGVALFVGFPVAIGVAAWLSGPPPPRL